MVYVLETILKYKMTPAEASAYKMVCAYQSYCLSNKIPAKIKINGDPRKSSLFKYCYKMIHDLADKLPESDFELYVRSQIDILSRLKNGDVPAVIEPNCLVGPNAWNRWLVWKSKYKKAEKATKNEEPIRISQITQLLQDTNEYLNLKLGTINQENLIIALDDGRLTRWVNSGKVTPYFILLSETVHKWLVIRKVELSIFKFDKVFYEQSIDNNTIKYFKKEFPDA